jgi:hypothetical protein
MKLIMDEKTLNTYLRDLKFVVIADTSTGKPIDIYFDFHLPSIHEEIFLDAAEKYRLLGKTVNVQGGGRITKKDNFIIFHGRSQQFGCYEDKEVLALAPEHPYFKDKEFIILSKAGDDNVYRIIEEYKKGNN